MAMIYDTTDNNVMLDLETLGVGPNAAILSVGAVKFGSAITDRLYEVIDLHSCVNAGLDIEPSTVLWWLRQSEQARGQFNLPTSHLDIVLANFASWIKDDAIVWGNGAAFDNVMLSNAYRKTGKETPWDFWNDRCYRTVAAMYPYNKIKRSGVHHRAVDDAESQALHLIELASLSKSSSSLM